MCTSAFITFQKLDGDHIAIRVNDIVEVIETSRSVKILTLDKTIHVIGSFNNIMQNIRHLNNIL
jgi:hypothetical protein